jgi:xylulokinase
MNMTGVLHEVRELLSAYSMNELTRLANDVEAGSNGLLFMPYLSGERTPDIPNATGSIMGIRSGSLRPGALFRSALEGIALALGRGVSHMRSLGLIVNDVHVVGGGANNPLLRQILASVINAPLRQLIETESAALGAALHAAAAVLDESQSSELMDKAVALSDAVDEPNAAHVDLYADKSKELSTITAQLWD